MAYLKNSIINFTRRTVDGYSVQDYNALDFSKIRQYIKSLDPTMIDWYRIQNNDTLERIALELYGDANYWDILLVVNDKIPLMDMPFDFDILSALAEDKVQEFGFEVYGRDVPQTTAEIMTKKYEEDIVGSNEQHRVIKIIKPSRLQKFLQDGFDKGYF